MLFVLKDGITIRPAHVIEAEGTACCLQVLLKPLETLSESAYQALVPHCEHGNAGTWHWPRFSSLPSHHGHAVIDPESSGAPGGVTNSPATPHPAAGAGDDRRQFSPDPHRELTGVLNG